MNSCQNIGMHKSFLKHFGRGYYRVDACSILETKAFHIMLPNYGILNKLSRKIVQSYSFEKYIVCFSFFFIYPPFLRENRRYMYCKRSRPAILFVCLPVLLSVRPSVGVISLKKAWKSHPFLEVHQVMRPYAHAGPYLYTYKQIIL